MMMIGGETNTIISSRNPLLDSSLTILQSLSGKEMIVLLIAVVLLALVFYLRNRNKYPNIPVVQGGLPFFGHVFQMVKGSPWDTMAAWVRQYGTICQFHLFGSDAICLADPELLKIVLQTKLHSFQKDVEWTYRPFMVLLGSGIVTSEGDSWFHQRKLLAAYMKTEVLDLIPDVTFRTTQRFIKKLEKVVEAKGTIEMAEEFRHLTLQIIGEAVLSLSPEECDATFAEMYLPIVTEGNLRTWDPTREYLPTPAWFKFQADVKRLNDYVTKLVVDRWNERKRLAAQGKCREKMDMLDKILDSLTDADWTQPTIDQVRDEIKTFVLAGHETTASMLAWTFYELSIDHGRDYADRVVSEAREAYGNLVQPDGNISKLPERAQLDKLFFTECCLREAIRKSSNVPTVVRMAVEDVQVGDYFFPRGTTVMVCMQGVHHNPAVWPDPLNYKPDRFKEKPKPFTFIPFLEGPRSCLGQYQALLESKLMLSILFSRFKFEAVDPVVAGERHPFMVPIIPKTGQYMRVTNRK